MLTPTIFMISSENSIFMGYTSSFFDLTNYAKYVPTLFNLGLKNLLLNCLSTTQNWFGKQLFSNKTGIS